MPPTNPARRRALADAAIDLLAACGVHGLTHRAVEKAAGLPPGTASNYFRSREALLVAAAERIVELHHADMDRAAGRHQAAITTDFTAQVVDLLTESLLGAATVLRNRYLAIFELQMEAVRRPVLSSALAGLQDVSTRFTAGHHAELGLPIPRKAIPGLIALYGGALFTLVTAPPETVTEDAVRHIVRTIVYGALPESNGVPDALRASDDAPLAEPDGR
ncbi:TetR family transcriptional regulator [Sphaerisporangium melleum]|uniref:TetR family transcriptional regulator n=1 Tax=Sphaerisporangium melleum TaxID=321316 RepID=A0A917RAB5_9ACTN|nr:TetR/AcrR family transcriptional regulator [Sphaerisporangium melleum]GGK97181.1 TetR family transcriptional regulator [Sphaerisporangium melleum]GII71084.1 TetR family transcriptional regulator [Sphaerisporangium melleum]